jgi:hypothetical protein
MSYEVARSPTIGSGYGDFIERFCEPSHTSDQKSSITSHTKSVRLIERRAARTL